ncbi:hypothetical protein Tco_0805630, partial [Tanacetum coccineum]
TGTNEGSGDKPEVPNVPEYISESEEESWTFSQGKDEEEDEEHDNDDNNNEDDEEEEEKAEDDDEVTSDLKVSTPLDYELTGEDENQQDNDTIGKEQGDEDNGELYEDLNINLFRCDAEIDSILNPNAAVSLREEAQAENDEFLKQIDSNIKNIIKDQVKAQVSKIMPKVKNYVTETLRAKILARSSNQPQSSYATATSLTEFELKKILIDKIEENKSMNRSDGGRNDQDKDEEPSAGSNRGSKRRRSGKEESSKETTQKESKSTSSSKGATRSSPKSSGKSTQEEEHDPRVDNLEEPFHQEFDTGNDDVTPVKEVIDVDERLWNPSGSQTPDREWNQTKMVDDRPPQQWMTKRPYPHDLSKPLPLILDARGHLTIPYDHFINNDLEYLKGVSSSRKYTTSITKIKAADYGHIKWIEDKIPRSTWSKAQVVYDKHAYWGTYHYGPKCQRFYGYATNMETSKDVYSKHRIIAVTSLKIMEFFGYKHLEEITVRRQDDKLYKFREGNFKRLQRVEDLQLAVKSYQKKINLTKPDTYRSDISKKTPYTAYRDIQSIIYQDDMNRNCLMRTDELHKFSDGTLNHVCTSLNDIATGIQMKYLPKRKWSKQDKQRARVMIKAIDKKLKDRRLMRSLEKFVGGRPYRGDLQLLQRTI